jgi:hypothetical protein
LHAEAPHEFARSDLDLLEHTASLVSGAVDNARLYEEATARVALLTDLSRLSQKIASAADQDTVLAVVTEGARELLSADRCEIYLLDANGRLRLAAARPKRPVPAPVDTGNLWLETIGQPDPGQEEGRRLAGVLWGDGTVGTPLVSPLITGDERFGMIVALVPKSAADAGTILTAVTSHAAVALRQHQLIESLRERNLLKDFFQTLSRPEAPRDVVMELARRLGCDIEEPHVLLHIVPWSAASDAGPRDRRRATRIRATWPDRSSGIEDRLSARFPGLLIDRLERSIRALLPLGTLTVGEVVASVRDMEGWDAPDGGVSVGISRPCSGVETYAHGFDEAASAAEVGGLIRGVPGVTAYDDLGPYKYVLSSEDGVRDRYREQLESLVSYDARRGTSLLDTLEGYLDHRGNVMSTSRALFIHPNTLRQRLGRIGSVSGIDLEHDDWLSLAVATKVVKLRRMRNTARERGNDG